MDLENNIQRRLRSQRLGTTYYSNGKIEVRSNSLVKDIKKWAREGMPMMQGALAGDFGHSLAKILAAEFNHNFDAYDKAVDAVYNAGQGSSSSLHHLLDGQHSIWGAFEAVRDVSPDDSFVTELFQASEHLMRDLCSVSGINPLFNMTKDTFDSLASHLAPLGISKMYLADALTVNGPEILGATLGVIAILLGGKNKSSDRLSEIGGSLALASIASANPALFPVAVYAIYRCIKNKNGKSPVELSLSFGKGALVTGTVWATSAVIGGPVWVGLTAGMAASIGVRYGLGKMSLLWERLHPVYDGVRESYPAILQNIESTIRT